MYHLNMCLSKFSVISVLKSKHVWCIKSGTRPLPLGIYYNLCGSRLLSAQFWSFISPQNNLACERADLFYHCHNIP